MRRRSVLDAILTAIVVASASPSAAYVEPPYFADKVAAGSLPPVDQRLPNPPSVVTFDQPGLAPGRFGGALKMLMSRPQDTRMMIVYGYARLVGYDLDCNLVPDILEGINVKDGRTFTLRLRKGHKWSDGHPFTAEDFRYYWQDVANNPELSPGGPDQFLLANGKPPRFEVVDETTVRYSWEDPNPYLLPALAGARPDFIHLPAHYMKRFHARYADPKSLEQLVQAEGQRDWVALHYKKGNQYQNDNRALPTLQPWALATEPPAGRFVFVRNPYYHRVDPEGRQLPYIDTVAFSVVSADLIPAKAAAGETDLQARGLSFDNYAVLKQGEQRNGYSVRLWRSARGSEIALYPNLNVDDPVWRDLLRNANVRRALSMAIDRREISQVIYFGLAKEGNDTVLPDSPLYKPEYATLWAGLDLNRANRLLDEAGLARRAADGVRLLPDGRRMEVIVETAGEDQAQVDVLELVRDNWRNIGLAMHIKPEQREVLRNRAFAGSTLMSVWSGLENALPNADSSPHELAPTSQQQLCWPKWGQHHETGGRAGEPVDLPAAQELLRLNAMWETTPDSSARADIWHRMLQTRAEQVFTIGTIREIPQPVVVNNRLRNVPKEGIYNWEPGAHFGIYHPDTFWWGDGAKAAVH